MTLAFTCSNAHAGKLGSEFRANTYTTNDQNDPSVAALSNGGFVVAWTSHLQDNSSNDVYAQRYSAAGIKIGGEFRVTPGTSSTQEYPSVAGLSGGGFVITWTAYRLGLDQSLNGIHAQLYDAAGTPSGSEFLVNTHTPGDEFHSSVAGLSNGGFIVTWTSFQYNSTEDIYGQRYSAAGARIGSEFLVNTYTMGDQYGSSVVGLHNGGFVVTWSSNSQDGSFEGVYGQRYSNAGKPLGKEFRVNTQTHNSQFQSSVTALKSGDFVVAWTSAGQQPGSAYAVYAQRYNATGARIGTEFLVNTTASYEWYPSIAALSDGGFVVAWHSANLKRKDLGDDIYAQRYDALGKRVGGQGLVNTHRTADQQSPSVVGLANGNFVVTWQSYSQDGSMWGVYGQLFGP